MEKVPKNVEKADCRGYNTDTRIGVILFSFIFYCEQHQSNY